jgi:signal transduction histidine kinase
VKKELEIKIKERTKELEESVMKLRKSESDLMDLNQVKDRLFSIISHDIKNPLTTLDSFLNLLMNHHDKLTNEEFSDLSSKTKFALQNLRLLLENLLQWSRLQQNHLPFNPDKIKVSEPIKRNLKLFSLMIEQKKIDVKTQFINDDIEVWADKDMIEFIARNLIHNALKFTPKGGNVNIRVDKNDGMVTVSVDDSGKGMSKNEIDRILIAGEGFSSVGTENERGNGIGLLMCKDFVERNGGELSINKNSEGGTTVIFEVPYYDKVGAIMI